MQTKTPIRSNARQKKTHTLPPSRKRNGPPRDRSPKRTLEVPAAAKDPIIARLEANTCYSIMEVLIMIMAYHCVGKTAAPESLVKKAHTHLGYKTHTRAVLNTLRKYRYNTLCDPEMPFEKTSHGWKLNNNAKIGFDDPEWEDFVFARVASPVPEARSPGGDSESSESSSRTEDEILASNSILELGSRPDDLVKRVEHLEKEIIRLAKIEKKYDELVRNTA